MAITSEDAAVLGLVIGRTTLKDVQTKLGAAKVMRVSRDEESDVSICYISPQDGTVLVLYSGVMAASSNAITWFGLWSKEAAYRGRSHCTPSTLVSRNVATRSGLGLGLTQEQVHTKLGNPTKAGPVSAEYEYLCRRKMSDEEIKGFKTGNHWDVTADPYFDRMSWINVRFMNGMVSRLEVGEIESY